MTAAITRLQPRRKTVQTTGAAAVFGFALLFILGLAVLVGPPAALIALVFPALKITGWIAFWLGLGVYVLWARIVGSFSRA